MNLTKLMRFGASCLHGETCTSWLLLSDSSELQSVHLQRPGSEPRCLTQTAPPQPSGQAWFSASAGSNHENHLYGPGSCFWTCTGIRKESKEGTNQKRAAHGDTVLVRFCRGFVFWPGCSWEDTVQQTPAAWLWPHWATRSCLSFFAEAFWDRHNPAF